MLNRGIGGAYGFTTDIGGFFDIPYGATSKELFIRWVEWAALSPMFRIHGSVAAGTHTPWSYDAETLRIYKRHEPPPRTGRAADHEALEIAPSGPACRSPGRSGSSTPTTATPPAQDQQWMLGRNVLVAPVVEEGAVTRTAYFPRGCWRTPNGEREYIGPERLRQRRLGRLPYFIRCGTSPLR